MSDNLAKMLTRCIGAHLVNRMLDQKEGAKKELVTSLRNWGVQPVACSSSSVQTKGSWRHQTILECCMGKLQQWELACRSLTRAGSWCCMRLSLSSCKWLVLQHNACNQCNQPSQLFTCCACIHSHFPPLVPFLSHIIALQNSQILASYSLWIFGLNRA